MRDCLGLLMLPLRAASALLCGSPNSGERPYRALGNPTGEPLGGQPPEGARPSHTDFDYQVKYQRAFEAVLWSLPAVAIHRLRAAAFEHLGIEDNDIIAYSRTATPALEALTPNSSTPYVSAYTDLRQGPVVLEVPAAGPDGELYGQVVDAWQFTIADVGAEGADGGRGGKYLFTPPGYTGDIPPGYIAIASPNYRIAFAFRSIVAPGGTTQAAVDYSHRLRVYPLTMAANPPQQKFVDPIEDRYPTLPCYDERFFDDLADIVEIEPVKPIDKQMIGNLESLGIVRGAQYRPDATARRAMRRAAVDVWYHLQNYFDHLPAQRYYWPDRHYASLLMADEKHTFDYEYDDRIDIIGRAAQFMWCIYVPKVLTDAPATQYLMAMADAEGKPLQAGRTYKLDIPATMPVRQFWALTVYDRATFAFVYADPPRTTLSSYDLDTMSRNPDGTVTLYVGPTAPPGLESNWIPTAGKRPLPALRFYGPTTEFDDKSFVMPDFVAVP
ncbi:DUF1254 domain-containing protein [Nocardia sp. BMG111209]|uniref:DUF1254 domain-containing protein n=1 Tax=Nocardia sp. BMG111209 TaxID=1160137 RepID=UPI00037F689B|nr:DUF1254 domain-containing protein [Nocardia sp. BMG111209]